MKTGTYDIEIRRGAAFSLPLTFTDSGGTPIDLTGKIFKAQIRDEPDGPLILDLTVTGTDLDAGKITISATSTNTANLPTGRDSRWDLLDDDGVLWLEGTAHLKTKISRFS